MCATDPVITELEVTNAIDLFINMTAATQEERDYRPRNAPFLTEIIKDIPGSPFNDFADIKIDEIIAMIIDLEVWKLNNQLKQKN